MTGDDWRELAAAYALDALEGEELTGFETRLAEDSALRELVEEYREVASSLVHSLPALDPPAALRQSVIDRARETPQTSSTSVKAVRRSIRSEESKGHHRGATAAWIALAASIAALVGVVVQNQGLRVEGDALRAEISVIRDSLDLAGTELALLDSLALLLSGPDLRFASLTDAAVQPSLRLVWNPERRVLLVAASNLSPSAPGRTYQLWGLRGTDAPVSLGTFDPGPEGSALLTRTMEVEPDFELSAITDEPAGGSPAPSTPPFLVGEWRSTQD